MSSPSRGPWPRRLNSLPDRHDPTRGPFPQPLIDKNTADPSILQVGKHYYLVHTSGGPKNVFQIQTSTDLVHWKKVGPVFPQAPKWTDGTYWAPELHRDPDGKGFVCYYTATSQATGAKSIGVAKANSITGPWKDLGRPLVPGKADGFIDPTFFKGPKGASWLLYKNDGNSRGKPTHIWIQRLKKDGVTPRGAPRKILVNDRKWEGKVVEAPEMFYRKGFFYLFYSGSGVRPRLVRGGRRPRAQPARPVREAPRADPRAAAEYKGPGHNSPLITGPNGKQFMAYHAWERGHIGEAPGRVLLMDRVRWVNGWPKIHNGHPSI